MSIIKGDLYKDPRGLLKFVNDFDMTTVVRMYCIEPKPRVVRAWQGHRKETKWFYAANGSFLVKSVDMDTLNKTNYRINSRDSEVLEIAPGHYNGFEALEEGSILLVFSDLRLEDSKKDDFRESLDILEW